MEQLVPDAQEQSTLPVDNALPQEILLLVFIHGWVPNRDVVLK